MHSCLSTLIYLIFCLVGFCSGFSVSVCGQQHIFKPVSVQAMWWVLTKITTKYKYQCYTINIVIYSKPSISRYLMVVSNHLDFWLTYTDILWELLNYYCQSYVLFVRRPLWCLNMGLILKQVLYWSEVWKFIKVKNTRKHIGMNLKIIYWQI